MNRTHDDRFVDWLAGADDAEVEARVLADDDLAEAAYTAYATADALAQTAGPQRGWTHRLRSGGLGWTAGLAAAVVALLMFALPGDPPGPQVRLRGDGSTGPATIRPAGTRTSFPRQFAWNAVPGYDRYRCEIYDREAQRRFVAVVADTAHAWAFDPAPADSAGTWQWLVVPLAEDGREGPTSRLTSFTVAPGGSE